MSIKKPSSHNLRESGSFTARSKESLVVGLSKSRAVSSTNVAMDMRRISEIIESNSKEQQNTINFLQESIAHYRDNLDKMEK